MRQLRTFMFMVDCTGFVSLPILLAWGRLRLDTTGTVRHLLDLAGWVFIAIPFGLMLVVSMVLLASVALLCVQLWTPSPGFWRYFWQMAGLWVGAVLIYVGFAFLIV